MTKLTINNIYSKLVAMPKSRITMPYSKKKLVPKHNHYLKLNFKIFRSPKAQPFPFYNIVEDSIHLPDSRNFKSVDTYYQAAFHELIHSTGSKLDRQVLPMVAGQSDELDMVLAYHYEEIVAEIGSMLLCEYYGVGYNFDFSLKYINHYRKRGFEAMGLDFSLPYSEMRDAFDEAQLAAQYVIDKNMIRRK